MSKQTDNRYLELLRDYRRVAGEVKRIVREIDPRAEVHVFGSVVKGRFTGASDIDILVVTDMVGRRCDFMVRVYKAMDTPVELHVASPEQFERWYRRFTASDELVRCSQRPGFSCLLAMVFSEQPAVAAWLLLF